MKISLKGLLNRIKEQLKGLEKEEKQRSIERAKAIPSTIVGCRHLHTHEEPISQVRGEVRRVKVVCDDCGQVVEIINLGR